MPIGYDPEGAGPPLTEEEEANLPQPAHVASPGAPSSIDWGKVGRGAGRGAVAGLASVFGGPFAGDATRAWMNYGDDSIAKPGDHVTGRNVYPKGDDTVESDGGETNGSQKASFDPRLIRAHNVDLADPAIQQRIADYSVDAANAQGEAGDAAASGELRKAKVLTAIGQDDAANAKQLAAERDKTYAAGRMELDRQREANEALRKAPPVDHDRYDKNMGVGDRFMSALSVGLGGVASHYLGGPNLAAKELDRKRQGDVAAQQEDYQRQVDEENRATKIGDQAHQQAVEKNMGLMQQFQMEAQKRASDLGAIAATSNSSIVRANAKMEQANTLNNAARTSLSFKKWLNDQVVGGPPSQTEMAGARKYVMDHADKFGNPASAEEINDKALFLLRGETYTGKPLAYTGKNPKPDAASVDLGPLGKGLENKGTNFREHPLDAITSAANLQDTEGYAKQEDVDTYNSGVILAVGKKLKGAGKSKEVIDRALKSVTIPKHATKQTIIQRKANAKLLLGPDAGRGGGDEEQNDDTPPPEGFEEDQTE